MFAFSTNPLASFLSALLKYAFEANWVIQSIFAYKSSSVVSILVLTLDASLKTFVEIPSGSSNLGNLSY